ncbi:MAG: ABC-F family ATP-binding cassette domain-containing protein [Ruminococcaceae bacterium]|nr:ABC-F family ATP-binding cassette domain-containing protein [Oscillospiraceae bacterium]
MIALTVDNISLSFGTKSVLCGISFSLDESDRLGVIGVNGSGKSTLFKLILGELEAEQGDVFISKDKSIGILKQDDALAAFSADEQNMSIIEIMYNSFPHLLKMESRLSVLEEFLHNGDNGSEEYSRAVREYSSLNEKFIAEGGLEFKGRCASTLQKMGFDENEQKRPFCDFSGGQRTRLALSRELCREPDILLLDEPTNHLDMETLQWLENFLASYKKCLLVISHDRYFLDRVTNKTLCIENNRAKLYNGGYTKAMEQRKIDREIEERHYKNQQKEIARQEAYIAQQRAWNRERNIIAAESRQKLLDKMEKIERPQDAPKGVRIKFAEAAPSGNEVMNVSNLSFAYPNFSEVLSKVSFGVRRNDKLFIVGANGSGKSTLIKLILGKFLPSSGYIEMGYNVRLGYYDQENQNLSPQNTVLEELWNAYPQLTELEVRNTLAQFRFIGDDVFLRVCELSGGERARLTLSKLILMQTNLLVLDEPTNHLDIASREALEEALEDYDGTVVIVSHDRYFIEKLATRIIDIIPASQGGGAIDVTVLKQGEGYAELCRDRERRKVCEISSDTDKSVSMSAAKEQYLKNKKENADSRKEKKRIERLQREAKKIEDELSAIDEEMNGEAAYDYTRLSELDTKKNELEERLMEIYEELEG